MNTLPTSHDDGLLGDLLEAVSTNPSSIDARKMLVSQCIEVGWKDLATDAARDLLALAPHDAEAKTLCEPLLNPSGPKPAPPRTSQAVVAQRAARRFGGRVTAPPPAPVADLQREYDRLQASLMSLSQRANLLHTVSSPSEATGVMALLQQFERMLGDDACVAPAPPRHGPPTCEEDVAAQLGVSPAADVNLVFDYFAWSLEQAQKRGPLDDDARRALLLRTKTALVSALAGAHTETIRLAAMHVEHEVLRVKYKTDSTFVSCEPVADIARENFYVTEDRYAWDLEELVAALVANNSVFRNPIDKAGMSATDIAAIVAHPLGAKLKQAQFAQEKLRRGVRPETVKRLRALGRVFATDMTDDWVPSLDALEAFEAWTKTLPANEQEALDKLETTKKDSHTGKYYTGTVSDWLALVRNKENCLHKAGEYVEAVADSLG